MTDKEIRCPCGHREYMEEHHCAHTNCGECCPMSLLETIECQEAVIDKQTVELEAMRGAANSYKMHYENAKAEAVKEFAERLKKKETTAISCKRFEGVVSTDDIDNLVKEFTEGKADE